MSGTDWAIVILLLVLVGGLAYYMGSRRREEDDDDDDDDSSADLKAERDSDPEPSSKSRTPTLKPEPIPFPPPVRSPVPAPISSHPEPAYPPVSRPGPVNPPARPDLVRIDIDHEDDEEVDPTRVGSAAGVGGGTKKKTTILQPPVMRIVHDDDADEDQPTGSHSLFLVSATAQTDVGKRRKRNEDSLLCLPDQNLFVVADGMGGHAGGDVASKLAVQTMAVAFGTRDFRGEAHSNLPRQASELARAIQLANQAILDRASDNHDLKGMGTTICAARFSPNKRRLFLGHVGDSRCYRLRDGYLKQMTADHTMAELGMTGPESEHLSRAVGIWPTVPIDIILGLPEPGDVYLLCSDGLTKMLSDDAIATVLRAEEEPKAAVDRLILFSNARGGRDNISIILVRVVPPNWKPAPSRPDPAELKSP